MSHSIEVVYCDAVTERRQRVLGDLAGTHRQVHVVDSISTIPKEAQLALVGVDDLKSALPLLRWLHEDRPDRPILLLWEGMDHELTLEAIRAGARDIIGDASAAVEAVKRAWALLAARSAGGERRGKLICIYSLKGGIGKSTLSANLPIVLHRTSRLPTTVVDLSLPCGNLEMYLDLNPPKSIGDVLAAGAGLDEKVVAQALTRHASGINLIAGPRPGSMEALCHNSVEPLLNVLLAQPGIVVMDLGSFPEMAHVSALEACDLVIVPLTPLISSVGTMPRAREFLSDLGITNSKIIPVINHAHPEAEPVEPAVMVQLIGQRYRHELPFGGAEIGRSLNEGLPVCVHKPKSPLAVAIDGLGRDVLVRLGITDAVLQEAPAPAGGAMGWLKSLFNPKGGAHVRA